MNYSELIDKLMQHYTGSLYKEEVAQAKKEFFEMAGIFDEESDDFEMKLAQFTDWYIFTHELSETGKTPSEVAQEDRTISLSDEERKLCQLLQDNRHSLFEFMKIKGEDVHVKDIFSGYKLVIESSPITIGFNRDELFEARLIPHAESYVFSSSFCIHPQPATRFILKEVKKVKKLPDAERDLAREKLIEKLFRMKHKLDQYKHVGLKDIYSNDSKLIG